MATISVNREARIINPTIVKFGYPDSLVWEGDHWVVLVRPAQPTLGSLVLAAKSGACDYGALPDSAFVEQAEMVRKIETGLSALCQPERINYLMLMMVDRNVHFHVIPRYSGSRDWQGTAFPDAGWPAVPNLNSVVNLDVSRQQALASRLTSYFDHSRH